MAKLDDYDYILDNARVIVKRRRKMYKIFIICNNLVFIIDKYSCVVCKGRVGEKYDENGNRVRVVKNKKLIKGKDVEICM